MPFGVWIILLLVLDIAHAQSGDEETDHELRISCTSHVSVSGNSLTCNVVGNNGNEDDEDNECEEIERISVRYRDVSREQDILLESKGNNIASNKLNILTKYNLTVQLKGNYKFNKQIDLRTIVKPKTPRVWNATFHQWSKRAVIHIWTPYRDDYLTKKQLFELDISSAEHSLIHNITSEMLTIEGEYLHENTEYHVKVRAMPTSPFRGTWSNWSAPLDFSTHTGEKNVKVSEETQALLYILTVSLVTLLLVTWSIAFFWRKKIHACMWPSIPHPKHTLVQIYKPIKGPPVSFDPKVFSDLYIHLVHKIEAQPCTEAEPLDGGDITETSQDPCSILEFSGETSDDTTASSNSTEESVSTRLSSSSSAGGGEEEEEEVYSQAGSGGPSPAGVLLELGEGPDTSRPGDSDPEMYGANQQGKDEAYVTMSSFYQIKK